MMICHCQAISDHDIHAAIDWMRSSDENILITPGRVYRALGKSANCGGCILLFLETMRRNENLKVAEPSPVPDLRSPRMGNPDSADGDGQPAPARRQAAQT